MNKEFLDAIEANPIIAAVKDEQGLQNCLGREELTVIFILYGDILGELWSGSTRRGRSRWHI